MCKEASHRGNKGIRPYPLPSDKGHADARRSSNQHQVPHRRNGLIQSDDHADGFLFGIEIRAEKGNQLWTCPGHNGGVFYSRSPIGRIFVEHLGEAVFRDDLDNSILELGDLLTHEGPALQAQKEVRTGEFYFKKGSYRAAATRFREATRWNPTFAQAWLRLGDAAEKQNDEKTVAEAYAKYLELQPDAKNAPEIKKKLDKVKHP